MTWKRSIPTIVACIVLAVVIFSLGAKINSTSSINNNTEQVHKLTDAVAKLEATQRDVRISSERADCRSAYSAIMTDVIRARDDLKIDADAQYYTATLASATGERPTQEVFDRFGATLVQLNAARDKVRALPRLDDAVDNGFTLDGTTYPACPDTPPPSTTTTSP